MRLTLSYAGFLVLVGASLASAALLALRYEPRRDLTLLGGSFPGLSRSELLTMALPLSAAGITVLAVVGFVGGWLLAGRMLRPLAAIDEAARLAGLGSLTHRIDLEGPADEIRRLADTFDDMLDRLERTFEEQRRFTANASHELRTPHAVMKTMLQVARADPDGRDVEVLLARLQEVNDRSIATLEALLHLARAERGAVRRERCDLADVLEDALDLSAEVAAGSGVELVVSTAHVDVAGDHDLLVQLAGNLVQNAVLHNAGEGGTAWVRLGRDGSARPVLTVENTGDPVAPDVVATLAEPFVRGRGRTRAAGGPGGSGLGLAIVAAIARVHQADLTIDPRPTGGLSVSVCFPGRGPR